MRGARKQKGPPETQKHPGNKNRQSWEEPTANSPNLTMGVTLNLALF